MGKKVFSVYMGDPDSSSHSELDLPATPWELIDALDKLRLEDGRESYWQVEDIGRYGFLAPLLDDSDLYQFNALAEQLSTFDHVEAIAFEGLVQMEVDKLCQTNGGELTLQRLLDLAYSVDGCHVVPEVRDDAALGRFYVENDFLSELEQVPDSVLELLDYAKIGEKMRRDEHGAMTPNGYVVREAELRQAPPNLGRPPRKPPYMIHFLCVSDVRAVKLYLPAKQAELDAVLDCLEVDSWQEVQLEECDTAMPEMWAFVDMAHTSMEQVNQFAQCLEMLDANGELAAFKAVASQLDIYKLEDAMALTEHLSEYAFEPNIHSLEDRAREELSLMADGPELDLLIRNLNLTAYGADLMYRDRGILSDYGYVHRPDGQPMHLPQQGVDMTIDRDVVTAFVQEKLLYEDDPHHNCVFVGLDENGEARHAHLRSTGSQGKVFRINVESSDIKHSFHKNGTDRSLYVFEAPIDLLSHITLYPAGWLEHSYVACCGTSIQPVLERLRQNPKLGTVYLCLDNDEAGEDACDGMMDTLEDMGCDVERLRPEGKDWNDDLRAKRGGHG